MAYIKSILTCFIGLILFVTACDDSNITSQNGNEADQLKGFSNGAINNVSKANSEVYRVQFQSLNAEASYREVKGVAELRINGDHLNIKINANGLQPGMIHPQHIHTAGSCPSPEADGNDDGFIDVIEGVPSYGGIFVSLDADLADLSFQTSFPNPENNAGQITYKQSVSVSELETATGEELNLDGRHIVLHGVSPDTDLLESVQSLGGLPSYLTLPIACGEIVRVN